MRVLLSLSILLIGSFSISAQWIQLGEDIDGDYTFDESGCSIGLSGDGQTLIVGASENDAGGAESGHAKVYRWDGFFWSQIGDDINGIYEGEGSGFSVSISGNGNVIAVGSPFANVIGEESGLVRVYFWDGLAWNQLGFDIIGQYSGDRFGKSTSLSYNGRRLAVGAYNSDVAGNNSGQVRVFELRGSSWIQLGSGIDGDAPFDEFGTSVDISGNGQRVVAGARGNDDFGKTAGQVKVLEWNGSEWNLLGSSIAGQWIAEQFGWSVAISFQGDTIVAGAYKNSFDQEENGAVRVYTWNGTNWSQLGEQVLGKNSGDELGERVDITYDGKCILVSTPLFDDLENDKGNVGRTEIFAWDGTEWDQVGPSIVGESIADHFGKAVAMSEDGSIVAVGAEHNDGNGLGAGHVRVFEKTTDIGMDESEGIITGSNVVYDQLRTKSNLNYQIHDLSGKLVLKGISQVGSIDVSSLSPGLFILQVKNEHHQFYRQTFTKL